MDFLTLYCPTVFRDVSVQGGGLRSPPMISGTAWNFRPCNSSLESSQQVEKDGVWCISVSVTVPELFAYMCTYYDIILLYGKKCIIQVIVCCAKTGTWMCTYFSLFRYTYILAYVSTYFLLIYLLTCYLLTYLLIYLRIACWLSISHAVAYAHECTCMHLFTSLFICLLTYLLTCLLTYFVTLFLTYLFAYLCAR